MDGIPARISVLKQQLSEAKDPERSHAIASELHALTDVVFKTQQIAQTKTDGVRKNILVLFSGLVTFAVMCTTAILHGAVTSVPKALGEGINSGCQTLADAIPQAANSLRQPAEDAVTLLASLARVDKQQCSCGMFNELHDVVKK